MTGLDERQHHLVEIACIVTEGVTCSKVFRTQSLFYIFSGSCDLRTVGEPIDIVINQPQSVLDNMNEWCQKTFAKNGLLERIKTSEVTLEEAEKKVLEYGECCSRTHW